VSISSTFNLLPNSHKATVIKEKLREALLYKKFVHKMLMKLTLGVNFIKISLAM